MDGRIELHGGKLGFPWLLLTWYSLLSIIGIDGMDGMTWGAPIENERKGMKPNQNKSKRNNFGRLQTRSWLIFDIVGFDVLVYLPAVLYSLGYHNLLPVPYPRGWNTCSPDFRRSCVTHIGQGTKETSGYPVQSICFDWWLNTYLLHLAILFPLSVSYFGVARWDQKSVPIM